MFMGMVVFMVMAMIVLMRILTARTFMYIMAASAGNLFIYQTDHLLFICKIEQYAGNRRQQKYQSY